MTAHSEPVIVLASMVPGHDGLAEVAIVVRYSNGAERPMALPYEAVGPALDALGVTSLNDLVGKPWTVLLLPHPAPANNLEQEPASEGAL